MRQDYIAFNKTGYFSSLICDYLDEKAELESFYNRFPKLENFKAQIQDKTASFPMENRKMLVSVLKNQYKSLDASAETNSHIELLNTANTFTITTGHQLNLFTGPLYFLYKIVSTINLAKTLKAAYPNQDFVPIYWMATEDHDFDEINFFNFKGKKFQWNKAISGAVGELSTEGLDAILNIFSKDLGQTTNAQHIKTFFENAYLKHDNLADATRFLANELFKDYGLVIVDANDAALKKLFIPYVETELFNQTSFNKVTETNNRLVAVSDAYKIQVNPREINLFYLEKGIRERIVFEDDVYKVLNTTIMFSKNAIQKELLEHPEKFSPNVIMRPLYQEVILPNLCYIGGGGELAYWMQLKDYFDAVKVPFPMLLLRNSVLIRTEKQVEKLEKLNITTENLFLKRASLINKKVRDISNIDIDFSPQKTHLEDQFKALYELAEQTDKSFLGAVKAQELKQLKGLDNLEKRLLKAQKRKLSDEVARMTAIKNELFPNESLQERNANFSEFYLEYGEQLIPNLIENLEPLKGEFLILNL
ncbi:bacillithiol biosynthesis cysteine-adding enzyme BshC [Algibacter amylolyticus]|uniref:Putative cysteine ligase BshC n=1 Tax=Algibacter amylolyticus TaxID=1608400 RepID=A0A5M7B1X1_9FLAO|nr:bacillithiol biosynthesis cysteine-adding enzyme BshC [Algibacter amylolyticus]KAA5823492.1 bacillithiol biosynthesis cysteine-adding enzyme BshC [Algibacter amylolyticus]MBB5267643.1 bacillithiol biosynthesis cysteine-adding enzyme BshC [Algibacter amylolyticus]TSJ73980.1 bacillithiol biosynthesis cysteine-adding enzyme BshC [Algibacter amylolyticus]